VADEGDAPAMTPMERVDAALDALERPSEQSTLATNPQTYGA
jgi:hypothetical protein